MALKVGKLIKDRYFFDDTESGLVFDLLTIFPQHYGDADELENAINERTAYAKTVAADGACTLGVVPRQYEELADKHGAFADKCYLMWFNTSRNEFINEIDIFPWNAYGRDGFIWNASPNEVYCRWDANGLGHRFRVVPLDEAKQIIDEWDGNTGGGDSGGGSSGGSEIPGMVSVPKKWKISLLGGLINGTVEAEE
jgi:hypothetical protein